MKNKVGSILPAAAIIVAMVLSSCSSGTPVQPDLDIESPDFNEDMVESSTSGWTTDDSGRFSYNSMIEMRAHPAYGEMKGDSHPYFDPGIEFEDNMFMYVTYASSVGEEKYYGYMDENFTKLTGPVNTLPNIFRYGLVRIDSGDERYVLDTDMERVAEYFPGFVIHDDCLMEVTWSDRLYDNPVIIGGTDTDSYLVPCIVQPGADNSLSSPAVGYKTIEKACFGTLAEKNDESGIPAVFEDGKLFRDGLAAVRQNGKWGFIDGEGNTVVDFIYDDAKCLGNDMLAVFLKDIPNAPEDFLKKDRWALMDTEGNLINTFIYSGINDFIDGFAEVSIQYSPSEGYHMLVDETGKSRTGGAIKDKKDTLRFNDGYVRISNYSATFYDDKGNYAFNDTFMSAGDFSEGLAAVKYYNQAKYGYIDTSGNLVIPSDYFLAREFSGGYAFVRDRMAGAGYLIDRYGNKYLEELGLYDITRFNDEGYALAYTIEFNEYSEPDNTKPGNFVTVERQDKVWFMVHINP